LLSQGATAQTGCTAQNQSRPTDQTVLGRASPQPGGQLADFGSGQLD